MISFADNKIILIKRNSGGGFRAKCYWTKTIRAEEHGIYAYPNRIIKGKAYSFATKRFQNEFLFERTNYCFLDENNKLRELNFEYLWKAIASEV